MSDPGKAVFLSYASQDSEAAKRICEALRAAGVEVWFDQSELRGGDAWDQKIRKQIKECALFVPVISANTNARLEGYFRREWRLAVDRMHDMDDEVPFLLPVVIDDTSDAAARVPERFRERQWIRIGGADSLREFAERARKLLASGARENTESGETLARSATRQKSVGKRGAQVLRARWLVPAIIGGALAVAVPVWKTMHRLERPAAQVVTPVSEARKLAEQARTLMEEDDLNRENFRLAEQLLQRAVSQDPADGEVLAIYAELSLGFLRFGFDQSPAREELARAQAERAIKLAPESFEARFARAYYYYRANPAEGDRLLRELLVLRPDDKRVRRTLGLALRRQQKHDESIAVWREANARGGDALALREIALSLFSTGRAEEAEVAVDDSLRLGPTVRAWLLKAEIQLMARGDLDGADASLRQLPPWARREDRSAFLISQLRLWQRDAAAAIQALEQVPRDFLADNLFTGPKSYLIGVAHAMAGRSVAARSEWQVALTVVEHELSTRPRSLDLLYWRALLLAVLGRGDAAQQARTVFDEAAPADPEKGIRLARIDLALGHADAALDQIEASVTGTGFWLGTSSPGRLTPHSLRLDPTWSALQGNPRYEKLIAKATISSESRPPNLERSNPPAADSKSVAVLAFANLSDDTNYEYFSDGISEELLNVLAKVPGLKVSARTSAFSFKGKGVAIPEIARQLGVAYVVEGSVRKAGNRVRITAQLIKASDGFHVWSDNFDRELKDIFAVQDEIAGVIAKNLQLRMGVSSTTGPAAIDPEVFEWYLQGREGWRQRNEAGYVRAEAMFARVLERQPDFARAHAGLSDVWLNRAQEAVAVGAFNQRDAPALQRILATAERAMQLDPGLAEAHAAMGSVWWMEWKLDEAIRELRLGLRLNPNHASAHQWLGRCLMAHGDMEEALQELKQAHELDPLLARIADNYSLTLLAAQRPQEALNLAERALALQPDSIQARRFQIVALAELGRARDCRQAVQLYLNAGGDTTRHFVSYALARIGSPAEADEILRSTGRNQREPSRGATLLALGRGEEWLAGLNPNEFNILTIEGMLFWPVFDAVRNDPRFVKLLATLGVTDAHARAQAWRAANRTDSGGPRMDKAGTTK